MSPEPPVEEKTPSSLTYDDRNAGEFAREQLPNLVLEPCRSEFAPQTHKLSQLGGGASRKGLQNRKPVVSKHVDAHVPAHGNPRSTVFHRAMLMVHSAQRACEPRLRRKRRRPWAIGGTSGRGSRSVGSQGREVHRLTKACASGKPSQRRAPRSPRSPSTSGKVTASPCVHPRRRARRPDRRCHHGAQLRPNEASPNRARQRDWQWGRRATGKSAPRQRVVPASDPEPNERNW